MVNGQWSMVNGQWNKNYQAVGPFDHASPRYCRSSLKGRTTNCVACNLQDVSISREYQTWGDIPRRGPVSAGLPSSFHPPSQDEDSLSILVSPRQPLDSRLSWLPLILVLHAHSQVYCHHYSHGKDPSNNNLPYRRVWSIPHSIYLQSHGSVCLLATNWQGVEIHSIVQLQPHSIPIVL